MLISLRMISKWKKVFLIVLFLFLTGMIGGEKRVMSEANETAIFAGGCFWCMQPPYNGAKGVIRTTVGYTGGDVENPSYQQVTTGTTGHYEAVEVVFDPEVISYQELLEVFWRNIDPTNAYGQFADIGSQYLPAIFYLNEAQKQLAQQSKQDLQQSGKFDKEIIVAILPAAPFYPAEDYHQNYYQKQPNHYEAYKYGSGRAGFIEKKWGKASN